MMSPRRPRRNLAGGNHSARRRRRVLPSGDHWARGLALRVAGRAPHPTEQAAGRGEIGNYGGDHLGGGRSYGRARVGARGHVGRSWWALRAPGAALSTAVCSASSYVCSSHGGDEGQRRRASVTAGNGTTARKRRGEEWVTTAELTGSRTAVSAGSGTA